MRVFSSSLLSMEAKPVPHPPLNASLMYNFVLSVSRLSLVATPSLHHQQQHESNLVRSLMWRSSSMKEDRKDSAS